MDDYQGRRTSRTSKTPADSKQRGASWQSAPRRAHAGFQQSVTEDADVRHDHGGAATRGDWEPTGWAARKEPLRSECVQRHYALLAEAVGDWRSQLPQADGSSLVLRMRVVDECNAVPFRGQLVAWATALGFDVVDNWRGGRTP